MAEPKGMTDWDAVEAMTDEEVHAAALADPDAQPMTSEELARMLPRGRLRRDHPLHLLKSKSR